MLPLSTIAEGITTGNVLLTKAESCFLFLFSSSEKGTEVIYSQVNPLTYPAVGFFTAGLSKAQLRPNMYKDPEVISPFLPPLSLYFFPFRSFSLWLIIFFFFCSTHQ